MFERMVIQSRGGPYSVSFGTRFTPALLVPEESEAHFVVDCNIARLYAARLNTILAKPSTIVIEASEVNKSFARMIPVFEHLIENKVRRDHILVAIGGGVIQDITCFIASTFLRGLPWHFVPTTLLAQADSCIGSKSSINLGLSKNIIGTFNAPHKVCVWTEFLDTLSAKDIKSGIGEIIKAHAIDGKESFDQVSRELEALYENRETMLHFIHAALRIKKPFIEADELDRGIRNIFNYGHTFGHAIESATNYSIPHGIAVTMGMDIANFVAVERGLLPIEHFDRMHKTLKKNYGEFANTKISIDELIEGITRDKKNTSSMLGLILPVGDDATIQRVPVPNDIDFRRQCMRFLHELNQ